MQHMIGGNGIPDNFNTWTTQKQRNWLDQNITPFFPNVPKFLQGFIPGFFRQPDINRSLENLPEWMDIDKYCRGQKFVPNHYFSILATIVYGLIYAQTVDVGRKVQFLGGNSHTPYLAFEKYVASMKWMTSWYNGESWIKDTEAYKYTCNVSRSRQERRIAE